MLALPTGTSIDSDMVAVIAEIIRRAIADGPQLGRRMKAMGSADMDLSAPAPRNA